MTFEEGIALLLESGKGRQWVWLNEGVYGAVFDGDNGYIGIVSRVEKSRPSVWWWDVVKLASNNKSGNIIKSCELNCNSETSAMMQCSSFGSRAIHAPQAAALDEPIVVCRDE